MNDQRPPSNFKKPEGQDGNKSRYPGGNNRYHGHMQPSINPIGKILDKAGITPTQAKDAFDQIMIDQ